jgi:hypothetical protein
MVSTGDRTSATYRSDTTSPNADTTWFARVVCAFSR